MNSNGNLYIEKEELKPFCNLANERVEVFFVNLHDMESIDDLSYKSILQETIIIGKNRESFFESFKKSIDSFVHPDYYSEIIKYTDIAYIKKMLMGQEIHKYRFMYESDSCYRWCDIVFIKLNDGEDVHHVLIEYIDVDDEVKEKIKHDKLLEEKSSIIAATGMGTWRIELFANEEPRMITDEKMRLLLGLDDIKLTKEELYNVWYSKIKPEAVPSVLTSVTKMMNSIRDENTYIWIHPVLGERYVRCGGVGFEVEGRGHILRGYHYDVTDIVLEDKKKMDIIASMANVYFCSYYIDMSDGSFSMLDCKMEDLENLIGTTGNIYAISGNLYEYHVLSQYIEEMQEFLDISTLNDRLKVNNIVSIQFEGKNYGWEEASFITGDYDEKGNLKHVIFAIRSIQKQKTIEQDLLNDSYTDGFTGLYNRKMYLEDVKEIEKRTFRDDFVLIYMDINELKNTNDSLGHAAGDELITGVVTCMNKCIVPHGRVYRIGGDEFVAIMNVSKEKLKEIERDFKEELFSWKGNLVKHASVSFASVMKADYVNMNFSEIEKLADQKMYEKKQEYYGMKGMDRRNENVAFMALKKIYTKILSVNLNNGTYSIIKMLKSEENESKGFQNNIFDWLRNFGTSGQVHADDLEEYLRQTSKEYILNCFKEDKSAVSISYRRKIDNEYKRTMMEIIPADNYTPENQIVFLFVMSNGR